MITGWRLVCSFTSRCAARGAEPSLLCLPLVHHTLGSPRGSAQMSGLLQNHVAAVTGSGSGIGRAIALGYAREGAQVAVLDINGEAAGAVAKEIRDAGGKAHHFILDVSDRNACRSIAAEVAAQAGRVSILVNNAGIIRR